MRFRRVSCLCAFALMVSLPALARELGPDDPMPLEDEIAAAPPVEAAAPLAPVAGALTWLALAGGLLLVRPLWLRNIYPGKTGALVRHSALAAGATFAALGLFAASLRLLDWLLGLAGMRSILSIVPVALSLVGVALLMRGFWPVLRELLALPEKALGGDEDLARRVAAAVARKVGRELASVLLLAAALVAVTLVAIVALGPAGAAAPDPARQRMAAAVYLALNVAAVAFASALFLAKVDGIFRQRCHEKVPLLAHRRFWRLGSLSLLWTHALPVAFALAAAPFLASWPAVLPAAFAVLFVVAGGGKALLFLLRYRRSLEQGDTEVVTSLPDAHAA